MRTTLNLSVLVFLSSSAIWAQSVAGYGAVTGTIRDSDGEGIPQTKVTVYNEAMSVRRVMVTTDDGIFDAAGLPPATGYKLKVTRKDFASWESRDFQVLAGERLNYQITLQPEATAARVEAGAGLPLVYNAKDGIAVSITRRQIDDLPAGTRRLNQLELLAPSVTTGHSLGTLSFNGEPSAGSVMINGLGAGNGFRSANSTAAPLVSLDAVEGVQVLSGDYPAEFGRSMGGVVNAVTRSGSNGFHGTAYGFFSNNSLSAADRYSLGQDLFQHRNQAGASVGGPIRPGKLFFFANMEMLDSHDQGMNRITNPLIANAAGTAVLPSNCKAGAAQCAAAVNFLQGQMNVLEPRSEHWLTGLARIDYRRSERNTFSFEADAMHSRFPESAQLGEVAPNGGMPGSGISRQDTHYGRVIWTGVPSGNVVNEMSFGVFQDRIFDAASQPLLPTGNLGISIAGVTAGAVDPDSSLLSERRYQLVDNFRVASGAHTFLVGVDLAKTRDWADALENSGGTYTYPSLTAFALDFGGAGQRNYTSFTQQFGDPARELRSTQFGVYMQDSWEASRRLRITYGVRWEKPYPPQPAAMNYTYYQTGIIPSPNIGADPRFGASFRIDDRTVVRAGFGMFHAPFTGQLYDALYLGNGIYQSSISVNPNQAGAPVFPNVLSASGIPDGTSDLMYATAKLRNPYTEQTTVAIERSLNNHTTFTVSYLGSRGVKLWSVDDTNLAPATKNLTYSIDDAAGQKTGTFSTLLWTARSDPKYAHIYQVENGGSSWYHALAVQLRKRMSHGFSLQASYTWSHALADTGGTLVDGFLPWNTYNTDHRADFGSAALDQRHRAVIDWVWQPTVAGVANTAVRHLLNGWEISGIATLASAQPATALVLVDGQQFAGSTMAYPGSMNGSGSWARAPFLPVNGLYAEPQRSVNARLTRTVRITERIKGQLMFEAYNVFNSPYDTGVNTIAYTVAGGVLKPVAGLGAGNASLGYPNGTNARDCEVAFRITF